MKKGTCFFLLALSLTAALSAQVQIFDEPEAMTAGKLFLDQVDKVSLYLSTDRIVYTPRLQEGAQLHMTITLLEFQAEPRSEALQDFILRHVGTFNKTLTERLKLYTPDLAREFNAKRDVSFLIQIGPDRQKIAAVQNGKWEWLKTKTAAGTPTKRVRMVVRPASKPEISECKKNCPALLKKKPKEKNLPL